SSPSSTVLAPAPLSLNRVAALPPAPWASSSPSPADAPVAGELRCQCLQTEAALIHPKHIAHVELIPKGHHCEVQEVIATMKNGKKVCLDPTAPWVKLIVTKIMNRYLPWGSGTNFVCFNDT
uniref:C-X-C motif chemokine n=1 Tax=Gopherus evgoodei TaxID=1825980 RepID=A0A8C4W5Q4_9SAUR